MLNITNSDILAGAVEVSWAVIWQLAVHAQSSREHMNPEAYCEFCMTHIP